MFNSIFNIIQSITKNMLKIIFFSYYIYIGAIYNRRKESNYVLSLSRDIALNIRRDSITID